ncbi:MAG: ribosome assembly RNA-binding protein YhbY [Longimicrobiales bacterium]|nr:ribosome assembly RNA-binding protein YhbY [Longimicrobiales bacterium]
MSPSSPSGLTSKQRAHLRSRAHHLKPILQVGSDGVTEAVLEEIEKSFNTRELLKVKVLQNAPVDVDEAADTVRDGLDDVHVVQTVGHTMVLYRPDPDGPVIDLPEG